MQEVEPGRCRYFFACLFVSLTCSADAWSARGHERINRIAQSLLQGKRRDQIRTLEHADLIDVADWEQKMTSAYPDTEVLHWHRQYPEWTCTSVHGLGDAQGHVRCDGHGAEVGSLYCALAYFFEHFAEAELVQMYPQPDAPIDTPEELSALQRLPASALSSASYLRWLSILIGDLHQPLHWLQEHEYGRAVTLVHEGQEMNLLTLWEEKLPEAVPIDADEIESVEARCEEWQSGWKHKLPTELFREWAREVAERLCDEVYGKMMVNHLGTRTIDPDFKLREDIFESWKDLAKELFELAGCRIAFVLNDILDHRRHAHGIKEGRGVLHRNSRYRGSWHDNMMKNAAIAAGVVPSLLVLFHWHSKRNAYRKAKAMV